MKIQIPTPCHENWETMHPGENGRYCNTCCKTVVNFTNMTPGEISAYLVQYQSQKICGRFTEKQLTVEYDTGLYMAARHIARSGWPSMKKIAAVFVLLFALSLKGSAQAPQKDTQSVLTVTGGVKRSAKITPDANPFTTAVPQLPALPVQCLEGKLGGVVITQQKKLRIVKNTRKPRRIAHVKRNADKKKACTPVTPVSEKNITNMGLVAADTNWYDNL
ncbi:hypothetical protein LL912_06785 [Niabella sp. CC-SYL272]|uniref:hypothetical protein n=1 Tax=Niabella agricola TaxID=2891571 RepID=UPI001F41FD95|nr:hypothetical protein [Niabella agricola]MCF3108477.1 hypothetical protein [Niabella agricola]